MTGDHLTTLPLEERVNIIADTVYVKLLEMPHDLPQDEQKELFAKVESRSKCFALLEQGVGKVDDIALSEAISDNALDHILGLNFIAENKQIPTVTKWYTELQPNVEIRQKIKGKPKEDEEEATIQAFRFRLMDLWLTRNVDPYSNYNWPEAAPKEEHESWIDMKQRWALEKNTKKT